MSSKLAKNINIIPDEGDLFEDEFYDYHQEMQMATMKPRNENLDYADNLTFDPFAPNFILKNTIFFDSDQESFCDPHEVRTPKQSAFAFQINHYRWLPELKLNGNQDSDDDGHEQDGANNHPKSEIQKIFNNAPGRMVSIIRQEADEIRFMEEELPDLTKIKTVKKIFDRLVQDVLNKIKGEDKRKTLMVMLFNKVDRNQVEKLMKRKNKTFAVQNYKKIIDQFDQADVNEAKKVLMAGVHNLMNPSWIYHKALHATFRKGTKDVRQCQIVLEKYMNQFRRELKNCCIESYVDRDEVMRIPSAIEREGF